MPKCGVMICGLAALVQGLSARIWGQTEIPWCLNTSTWESPSHQMDGRTCTSQVITQGNAHVLQMGKLLRDKHLSVRIKHTLVQTALRPLLEYGAEVLVPIAQHVRALESMQPKAARMILGCQSRISSDVIRADLGLQLLSSRREIAELKWQHRLHGLLAHRLERILYDRVLPAPAED